jgi:hypothetical protein
VAPGAMSRHFPNLGVLVGAKRGRLRAVQGGAPFSGQETHAARSGGEKLTRHTEVEQEA